MDLSSLPPPPPRSVPPPPSATVANPTPPALNHDHPPYAEMICAAITALKGRDGSSKRAIAKYIEKAYTNLPPTHSALLTHHLKRLRNTGNLVVVKKSYKLPPGSDPDAPSPTILPTYNGVVNTNANNNNSTSATPTATVPSARGRGRPRKSNTGPVLVAAAVDKPKRGRGRPRKTDGTVQQRGPVKRRPGRPKKPKTVKGRQVMPQAQAQAQAQDQLNNAPVSYVTRDSNVHVPMPMPVPLPVPGLGGARRRGRPKKVGTDVGAGGKRLGSGTGRSVGRPKKNLSSALTKAAEAQVQAIADLKRKLEFFQSKVKQVVTVLKPQVTGESQISAVAAIQELEGLASMDVSVPLKEDTQPPVLQS